MDKLIGQVIAMTKNIWLSKPESEDSHSWQFLPGWKLGKPLHGMHVTWWCTRASDIAIENLSYLIIADVEGFSSLDYTTAIDSIRKTLREVSGNRSLFNANVHGFGFGGSVFKCMVGSDVKGWAREILSIILKNLEDGFMKWCTVYAAPRFYGDCFDIPEDGLKVIKAKEESWEATVGDKYETLSWEAKTGNFPMAIHKSTGFSGRDYNYLFIVFDEGTQKGSLLTAEIKLRRFFAIFCSFIEEFRGHNLLRSGADSYRAYIQFPETGMEVGPHFGIVDYLVPYYAEDVEVAGEAISAIKSWYQALELLDVDNRSKVEKCAHFINRAMNAGDIEAYINNFIALDALFGKRGSVESSIIKGIASIGIENNMNEKIHWLFDLRNELVHGGSRRVTEWPYYHKYYKHFRTRPESDIKKISRLALMRAPSAFAMA
jgi:hypothetical protein